jgi:hypothetical protein
MRAVKYLFRTVAVEDRGAQGIQEGCRAMKSREKRVFWVDQKKGAQEG